MYIKFDKELEQLLCCSLCKNDLVRYTDYFICQSCGLKFPKRVVKTDDNQMEFVFDFRILRPTYCTPAGLQSWEEAQSEYEQYHESSVKRDLLKEYLDEIDSVYEIYTTEFHIEGRVLDVGGHQGRLRHYLGTDVTLYVSADPYLDIFSDIGKQPSLLQAYPCLSEPCNFVSAHAEYLPFKSGSFDWVHMRSVVDHFADPYLAFLEAYRCSKVGGKLMVGLALMEKKYELDKKAEKVKLKWDGFLGLLRAVSNRVRNMAVDHTDDHMFRLTQSTLRDLYVVTGWNVVKEHWQKPPFQFCIYTCAEKKN